MSILIETNYEGKYRSSTKTPLSEERIAVNAARFNPVDLLASAYGSCLLGTIDWEARKEHFETTESRSEITYDMSEDESKVGKINIKIFFKNDYTPEQKAVIEVAAKTKCHVGKSLDPSIEKNYEFIYKND